MKRPSRAALAVGSASSAVVGLAGTGFQHLAPEVSPTIGLPVYIALAVLAVILGGFAMTTPPTARPPARPSSAFIEGVVGGDSNIIGNSSNARVFVRGRVQDRARLENNTHTPPEDQS